MAIDFAALRTELSTDPNGYGYAPLIAAGNYEGLAALVNLPRAAITMRRNDISALEVLEAIDTRDFVASPTALQSAWFESITQYPRIRFRDDAGVNTRVRANLNRLVNDTQGSQTRLDALAVRQGSRAEQLFGRDTDVSYLDIGRALGAAQ